MATALTFQPGRVPGIGSARLAPIGGMSEAQRKALSALIHEPVGARESERRDLGTALVWLIATATAFLWSLAIALALVQEIGWVRQVDALAAANSPASHAAAPAAHAVAAHSSATANRTM